MIFLISLLVPVMSFVPGFLLARLCGIRDEEEQIVTSFGFSFLVFSFSALLGFLVGLNQKTCNLSTFFFVVILLIYLTYKKSPLSLKISLRPPYLFPLLLLMTYYSHLILLQSALPVYAFGEWYGDWWMHYDIANTYLGKTGSQLVSKAWFGCYLFMRTPFFNLISAYFFSFLGNAFWKYQIISSFLNSCFILSLYLVTKMFFGKKVARFSFFILFFNPWIMRNALYTWPKLFCTYSILLSLYFYEKCGGQEECLPMKEQKYAGSLAGLFAGLAYMSHPFALFYIIALVIDFLVLKRRRATTSRFVVWRFCLAMSVVIMPWYIWVVSVWRVQRIFWCYLLLNANKADIYQQLRIIPFNIITSCIPYPLISDLRGHHVGLRAFHSIYNGPLLGAITLSGTIFLSIVSLRFLAFSIFKKPKAETTKGHVSTSPHLTLFLFTLLGIVGGIFMHRGVRQCIGILHATSIPSVLIILVYVARLVDASRWRWLVFRGMVFEFIVVIWLYLYCMLGGLCSVGDNNWNLKTAYQLVFIKDYLGKGWLVSALLALALEIAVV